MSAPRREVIIEAVQKLEHGLMHLRQSPDVEAEYAYKPIEAALRILKEGALYDVVFASTCAEEDECSTGNIRVGVTAHCRCGHSFADDVITGDIRRGVSNETH